MPQEQKNELIKQYITQLAIELNTQYPNLFKKKKIKKAYEMFQDSNQSQEEIKRQGNEKFDSADHLLIILSFIYDINFKETFEIIENEQYINKTLKRFDFKDKETKEEMKEIEKEIEQYINSNIV